VVRANVDDLTIFPDLRGRSTAEIPAESLQRFKLSRVAFDMGHQRVFIRVRPN
jgi:hypothetical protein